MENPANHWPLYDKAEMEAWLGLMDLYPLGSEEEKALSTAAMARFFCSAPLTLERNKELVAPSDKELSPRVAESVAELVKIVSFMTEAESSSEDNEVESNALLVDLERLTIVLEKIAGNWEEQNPESKILTTYREAVAFCRTPEISGRFKAYLQWIEAEAEKCEESKAAPDTENSQP